jgi:hypothetical protein
MSYLFKGFPEDIIRYVDPPVGNFGLITEPMFSSLGEDVTSRSSYRDTYTFGKGIQKVDYGSL